MNQLIIPPMRAQVFALETELKKLPQIEIPVRHYFSPGLYAREMTVPATAIIVGYLYKYPQINILSKGSMAVSIDDEVMLVEAPHTVVSSAGVKRAAMAVTECVWTTIVHTFLIDIDAIEKEFFAKSEEEYSEFIKEQASQWLA